MLHKSNTPTKVVVVVVVVIELEFSIVRHSSRVEDEEEVDAMWYDSTRYAHKIASATIEL